jgi:hypothetical protein
MRLLLALLVKIFGYGFVKPIRNSVLGICISQERNILIAEKKFIKSLVSNYGN